MVRHRLPEEDTLHHRATPGADRVNIGLLVYPYAANLDEFDPLIHQPGVAVVPVREAAALGGLDAIILPGSKHTVASLAYLRESGLAGQVSQAAARGTPILGVCGGLQILGREIRDPDGIEGGSATGLGLLDLVTTLEAEKTTRQRSVRWLEGGLGAATRSTTGGRRPGPAPRPTWPTGSAGARAMCGASTCTGSWRTRRTGSASSNGSAGAARPRSGPRWWTPSWIGSRR